MSEDAGINDERLTKLAYGGEALNYQAGSSFAGSAVGRIADKWKCSLEEAEHKIKRTMDILTLDQDNAIAFLEEVRLEIGRQPGLAS